MGSESLAVREREDVGAVVPREQAGMLAMATMPEAEFEQRLVALKRGQDRIKRIKQELMEEDAHYGVIPGTKKPTLLKPGAEVLCSIYGLRPDFLPTIDVGDGITTPTLRVTMRCELHLGDITGPVVAVGYGSANSWERKHRYRRGERVCPACGVIGNIRHSSDGWYCWKKIGGCGAQWENGAPAIEGQQISDVENPDPYDLENTLVKMAKKRAHIDAALTGTASSDLFTQDLDEQHEPPAPKAGPKPAPRPVAAAEPGADEEPPAQQARAPQPARKSAPPAGPTATCPQCGNAAGPSQYPKPGATHFCRPCKNAFAPEDEQ